MNTAADLEKIRSSAEISLEILKTIYDRVKAGVTGAQLDTWIAEECEERGVKPAFKGVASAAGPFPGNFCLSINDVVLHGIPRASQIIQEGDLVSLDFGINNAGYYTDHCITVGVGEVADEDKKLLEVAQLAVATAAEKVRPGLRTGDLGHTMHEIVSLAGFDTLRDYIGHGIGKALHLPPDVPAYGRPGSGTALKPGMVICVEAQVVAGSNKVYTESDGWTIRTSDGGNSVMFEYMVEVTQTGSQILTDNRDWSIYIN